MPSPDVVRELVKRFEENLDSYRSGRYNETQLRREFLDPLFEALGWDVFNKAGYAEAYKDVIHEDSLEVEGALKAPDYAFRIGGGRKFFVEAKKPSVRIETDVHPAFQLRRYSWSAKLPLGILTDFEEFAVYDCRSKPDKRDKASTGRVAFYKYTDYVEKWDEIAETFSREAVLKGAFDKYAEGVKGKKGTAEVDDAFLAEIERWRELLAKNFALRNPSLTTRELNYAVQMTIDRIIFLRICEDRGIEPYGRLKDVAESGLDTPRNTSGATRPAGGVYEGLVQIFQQADARYNSGLFHFSAGRTAKAEKEASSAADSLTLSLNVDDKVLRDILGSLYYPESPYVFSEIPSDILGQVYERFLGKVIRLTAGHQAKVEEKPEVRKAGGVYYTPTYIVEYIVRNTVGKLLDGKTPKDAAKLTILDPACGSGTFPLGAFQYLLDWHLKWYTENDPEKWAKGRNPVLYEGRDGYRLTTAEKKRILLNNIYGVDIDPQTVEVTKLSLLLKVLEGESEQTIGSQLALIQERALPDLGRNIKCGNSLIGPDYYQGHQLTMGFADEEERYRVNAFDWKAEFPHIFIGGGFDVVIGNPPYGADFSQDIKHYLAKEFDVTVSIADSFILFITQSLRLARNDGLQGFIIPSTWLYMPTYKDFRKHLLTSAKFIKVILFRKPVFKDAVVETCIEITKKSTVSNDEFEFIEIKGKPDVLEGESTLIKQSQLSSQDDANFIQNDASKEFRLFSKVAKYGEKFGKVARIVCGLTPYRKGKGKPAQTQAIVESKAYDADHKVDNTYRQYLMGRDFHRYQWNIQESRWISYGEWLAEPRYAAPFDDDIKIVIRQTADSIIAQIDTNQYLSLKNVHNVRILDRNLGYPYLLGLLNSKLITWWYRQLIPEKGRVFAEVKVVNLEKLPIRPVNFSDPTDKARHDVMVQLVEGMLELHKMLKEAKSPRDKEYLERNIKARDREIDKLVYALYGLSEEEIKIVEGTG